MDTIAHSLPRDFHREEWEEALRKTVRHEASGLRHAGAALAYLWSKTGMYRLLNNIVLMDDSELPLLPRVMTIVKCFSAFVLDEQVR